MTHLLFFSPCLVSPISLTLGISQPGAKLARSLGANVEESALNWTNSLATPPRDVSLSAGKFYFNLHKAIFLLKTDNFIYDIESR